MKSSTASTLRNNPNIEIQLAAEEIAVAVYEKHLPQHQTTFVFEDNSVLICDAWKVLFSN